MSAQRARARIFATCPPSSAFPPEAYPERVADVARWSEEAGCEGILVYADNSLLDPWLVAGDVLRATARLAPLVAVQPVYMHPYSVAKMVASLAHLHGRAVHLNMVSGGFKNDLLALGDETPHDRRYDRLIEYTKIVQGLLQQGGGGGPVSLAGDFYRVEGLRLQPAPPEELRGEVFVSGSSEAGMGAARALGALAVKYPRPADEEQAEDDWQDDGVARGVRVGVIAREDEEEAWRVAHERFPGDRKGQLTHQLAMKVSDSLWHQQLSRTAERTGGSPYWLFPFQNYKTMCPYLVGSYERVGEELGRYVALGAGTFILDVPPDDEELHHTRAAFEAAGTGLAPVDLPRAEAAAS